MFYIVENLFWSIICSGMVFGIFMTLDKISQQPVCKGAVQWTSLIN